MEQTGGESRKRFLLVAIAIACGALAIVLLYSYLASEKQKVEIQMAEAKKERDAAAAAAAAQPQTVPVFVAARPVEAGAKLVAEDLATQNIPAQFITPQAVNANSNIIGMVAKVPLAQGEQILNSKISTEEKPKILSELTPPGKRAVPVAVDNFAMISNLVNPGDFIDVYASIVPPEGSPLAATSVKADKKAGVSLPLFQNVQVLLVGNGEKKSSPRESVKGGALTLALTPQEAALVEFVQEQGKIRAVVRSNQDMEPAAVKVADWDSLFEYLYPDQKGMTKRPTVEIFRGLKKETVPLVEGKTQ